MELITAFKDSEDAGIIALILPLRLYKSLADRRKSRVVPMLIKAAKNKRKNVGDVIMILALLSPIVMMKVR